MGFGVFTMIPISGSIHLGHMTALPYVKVGFSCRIDDEGKCGFLTICGLSFWQT